MLEITTADTYKVSHFDAWEYYWHWNEWNTFVIQVESGNTIHQQAKYADTEGLSANGEKAYRCVYANGKLTCIGSVVQRSGNGYRCKDPITGAWHYADYVLVVDGEHIQTPIYDETGVRKDAKSEIWAVKSDDPIGWIAYVKDINISANTSKTYVLHGNLHGEPFTVNGDQPPQTYYPQYYKDQFEYEYDVLFDMMCRKFPTMVDDCIYNAVNQTKALDLNGLAYLKDIAEVTELSKSLVELATSKPITGLAKAKKAANAFLISKYALQTGIDDTLAIAEALDTLHPDQSTVRSHTHNIYTDEKVDYVIRPIDYVFDCYGKLSYSPISEEYTTMKDEVNKFRRKLWSTGLSPTSLESLWDFVPFSFVIDWFIGLGSSFSKLDTNRYAQTIPVHSFVNSVRIKRRTFYENSMLNAPGTYTWIGSVTESFYVRTVNVEIPHIPVRSEPSLVRLPSHFIEGAALIIQKL